MNQKSASLSDILREALKRREMLREQESKRQEAKVRKLKEVVRPKAALWITDVLNLLAQDKSVYVGYRKGKWIEHIRGNNPEVRIHTCMDGRKILFIKQQGHSEFSAGATNLICYNNGYNDTYVFATKHEAKKYVYAPFVK